MSQYAAGDQTSVPSESRTVRLALPTSVPYVAYTILAVTSVVYVLQLMTDAFLHQDILLMLGAKANDLIRAGQVWRLITPVLLHASVPHILFNMYALLAFGAGLERRLGHWRFLALYVLAGFAGNVLSFLLSQGYSVGASTAIFGLVGAEAVLLYQNRGLFGRDFGRAIGNIVFIVAVNLFLGLSPGIDNWGHVGGLLGGLVFAWFGGPVWEVRSATPMGGELVLADRRGPRQALTGAATVMLIFGALAAWGMLRP